MDKPVRFIDISVPVQTCNLRCPYCYIAQKKMFLEALPYFRYDAETIGRAMSKERLGGTCHLNLCGGGETLLPPEMKDILYELLKDGHYIAVVTNGTVTKRFDEIALFPEEFRSRLLFKFSFHYRELKRLKLFKLFWDNVHRMQKAGCSISIELTPYDELEEDIDDIRRMCIDEVGAPCHVTVARDETNPARPILTSHTKDEYKRIWGVFDSPLFDFKLSTFNVKRKEFCYAGSWTASLNLGTGILRQCYCGMMLANIFEDIDKPIEWKPIGCNCADPHCHNSHVWLTLGDIPELETPTYALMRNRLTKDGSEWLTERMKSFLSCKLEESNPKLSEADKKAVNKKMRLRMRFTMFGLNTGRLARRLAPKSVLKTISKKLRRY